MMQAEEAEGNKQTTDERNEFVVGRRPRLDRRTLTALDKLWTKGKAAKQQQRTNNTAPKLFSLHFPLPPLPSLIPLPPPPSLSSPLLPPPS